MSVFCDRLKFGSTAALDCHTGLNKGRYHKNELLLLLVLLSEIKEVSFTFATLQNKRHFNVFVSRLK